MCERRKWEGSESLWPGPTYRSGQARTVDGEGLCAGHQKGVAAHPLCSPDKSGKGHVDLFLVYEVRGVGQV